MIIGSCGFVGTGSSTITDLLKEYDGVMVCDDREMTVAHTPDGLEDLEYQLFAHATKHTSSVVAMERFRRAAFFMCCSKKLTKAERNEVSKIISDFVDAIVQVRWNGYASIDRQLFSGRNYESVLLNMTWYKIKRELAKRKIIKLDPNKATWPLHRMDFAVRPENFDEESQKFVRRILEFYKLDLSQKIVLDQPFCGNNPMKSFKYFGEEDCRAIVVDRDPRDKYINSCLARKRKGIGFQVPIDTVEDFVTYYRNIRLGSEIEHPQVLRINMEELIYEYEDTRKRVEEFCDLSENLRPRTHFDPSVSIANTQLYKKYPEYQKEVEYIEKMLPEFLFDFDKYGEVDTSGAEFFGSAPAK